VTRDQIVVGSIQDLSGRWQLRQAAQERILMRAEEINEGGGIDGRSSRW